MGWDDFLVSEGAEAFKALPETEFDLTAHLARLNAEYAYARDPGCIVRRYDGHLFTRQGFELDVFNRTLPGSTVSQYSCKQAPSGCVGRSATRSPG